MTWSKVPMVGVPPRDFWFTGPLSHSFCSYLLCHHSSQWQIVQQLPGAASAWVHASSHQASQSLTMLMKVLKLPEGSLRIRDPLAYMKTWHETWNMKDIVDSRTVCSVGHNIPNQINSKTMQILLSRESIYAHLTETTRVKSANISIFIHTKRY